MLESLKALLAHVKSLFTTTKVVDRVANKSRTKPDTKVPGQRSAKKNKLDK